MFGIATATKPAETAESESAAIDRRVKEAEAKVAAAATEIPVLRAEDGDLERQISQLLGEQIAEGDTRHGPAITAARARRRDIATQIEDLEAQASAVRHGLEQARRLQLSAQIRETRSTAVHARTKLADNLDAIAQVLPTVAVLAAAIDDAVSTESNAWQKEMALRDKLDPRDAEAAPHSDVHSPLDRAFELISTNRSAADLAPELDRLVQLAAQARMVDAKQ